MISVGLEANFAQICLLLERKFETIQKEVVWKTIFEIICNFWSLYNVNPLNASVALV